MPAIADAGHEGVSMDPRVERLPSLRGADTVVHLAAIAHRRGVTPEEIRRVNVGLTEEIANAAARAGARLIFMSSVKVHGECSAQPFHESSAIAPQDDYAASKANAEALLRATPGLRLTVLRPPLVYGPAVKANFLALIDAIARGIPLPLASIKNRRSLIYVGNLVDAVLQCIAQPAAIGRTYLVSDADAVSIGELCMKLGTALGRGARLFAFPVALLELFPPARKLTRSLEVDTTAITGDLGWQPRFSIDEGLRRTVDWYQHR
jgi:nucleoside-diphosphate-sugar epimerase